MIAVVSDTHREAPPVLPERALDAVRGADLAVHAGDVTTPAALDALDGEARRIEAVHGNADVLALRERLPAERTFEVGGLRVAVVHGHEGGETALSLLGRQEGADLVVAGHTHRPAAVDAGGVTLLNPGSPTEPRGAPATHAEVDPEGRRGRIVAADGSVVSSFSV